MLSNEQLAKIASTEQKWAERIYSDLHSLGSDSEKTLRLVEIIRELSNTDTEHGLMVNKNLRLNDVEDLIRATHPHDIYSYLEDIDYNVFNERGEPKSALDNSIINGNGESFNKYISLTNFIQYLTLLNWQLVKIEAEQRELAAFYYNEELESYVEVSVSLSSFVNKYQFFDEENFKFARNLESLVKKDQSKISTLEKTDEQIRELGTYYINYRNDYYKEVTEKRSPIVSHIEISTIGNEIQVVKSIFDKFIFSRTLGKYITNVTPPTKAKQYILSYDNHNHNVTITSQNSRIPSNSKINFNMHYNFDANKLKSDLKSYIRTNHSGLFLFRGQPGTGKSSFIRMITHELKDYATLIIPVTILEKLDDPEIQSTIREFIRETKTIIIIEDAESVLGKRSMKNRLSGVTSFILNVADGDLFGDSDVFLMCTINTGLEELDDAIGREGRLIADLEFEALSTERANFLASEIGLNVTYDEEVTVAKVYAQEKMLNIDTGNGISRDQTRIEIAGYKFNDADTD